MSSSHFIVRQAILRAIASLGGLVLIVAIGSVMFYREALNQAIDERVDNLTTFYMTRLDQLELDWEIHTQDFKVRIETNRLLENPVTALTNLQAFMTVQGVGRHFQYLLIQTKDGR
jgi:hypothetical protein